MEKSASKSHKKNCGFVFSLVFSVSSISIAWGSLLTLNSIQDRISLLRGFLLTSLGWVYFVSLTDFLNKILLETSRGWQLRKKYNLMKSDVLDITNKIVSAVQASFSCLAGFIVCRSSCSRGFLTASHLASEAYAWFGAAYFFFDLWSMYKVHLAKIADTLLIVKRKSLLKEEINNNDNHRKLYDKSNGNSNGALVDTDLDPVDYKEIHDDYGNKFKLKKSLSFWQYIKSEPLMVGHHIFIGSFGLCVISFLRGGLGDCIFSTIYLMEASTPFVSFRSVLSSLGLKNHKVYVVNGLLMLATFFIFRILLLPVLFHMYSEVINKPLIEAIMGLPRGCKISICILFLPQYYWFYLIVRGALKVFRPQKVIKTAKIGDQESSKLLMMKKEMEKKESFLKSNNQLHNELG